MNLKGVFKNVASDLTVGGGIIGGQYALSKVPFMNDKPVLKNVAAYGVLRLVGGKLTNKKGFIGDLFNGAVYGFASQVVASGLKKIPGMGSIADSYINGPEKYIRIQVSSKNSDPVLDQTVPAYVKGL